MQTKALAGWPTILPESTLPAFSVNKSRQRPGVIKLLPPPTPPDEKTIRELNELAAQQPFCQLHKVRKHDML
jgi:hypothetical protein